MFANWFNRRRKIRDQRLAKWPVGRKYRDGYQVTARFLTPLRMVLLYECFIRPLSFIWKALMLLWVIDLIVTTVGAHSLFIHFHSLERWHLTIFLSVTLAFYFFERLRYYPVCTFLFGRRLKIRFFPDKIIVRGGVAKAEFDRDQPIHFAYSENKHALHPFYKISYYLEIVVDDIRTITVDNVLPGHRARPIAANCNFFVSYTARNQDYDIDPQKGHRT